MRYIWTKFFGTGLILLAGMGGTTGMAATRLAILPETATAQPVADVLTATLSSEVRIQLVERTELNRVMAEQGAPVHPDALKLGHLLHADGVLLVSLSGAEANQWLKLRLMAVKPGVVIRDFSAVWPPADLRGWSSDIAQRLGEFWPKLAVLPKDAVPISILNLRSAFRSAEAEALERELTSLLQRRLVQQPEVFVLERRRLELLAEEKELGLESAPFWAGGYLLEGLIDKERFDSNKVTISGRLIPPDRGKAVSFELSGTRTNLSGLVEALARQVLATVKAGAPLQEWDPEAEAAEYCEEARWATKWRMWREAQAASEVSWALGRQTKEVAEMRVRSWRETGLDHASCTFELRQMLVNYSAPPEANDFADIRRAADLFESGWRQLIAGEKSLDKKWFELGLSLVGDLSAWLRHYYFMAEARNGEEQSIQLAQQQAERICRLLVTHPDYPNRSNQEQLPLLRALLGSFWAQTPEAGLELYRELWAAGEWPLIRGRFLNASCFAQESSNQGIIGGISGHYDAASPMLTGWKWGDRQRVPRVWAQFIDEWCSSTNPVMVVEGHYLRCCYAWSGEEFEAALEKLLAVVWDQRQLLRQANLLSGWRTDLKKLVGKNQLTLGAPRRLDGLATERRKRIEADLWPTFERKCDEFIKVQGAVMLRAKLMADARNYFTTANEFNSGDFGRWHREKYSADEAKELLPLVQGFRERLQQLPAGTRMNWTNSPLFDFEMTLRGTPIKWSSMQQSQGTNMISRVARGTNFPPRYGELRPMGYPPGMAYREREQEENPQMDLNLISATNFFRDARFWRLDQIWNSKLTQPEVLRIEQTEITDLIFRESKLWVAVRFRGLQLWQEHAVICAIDPATMATEVIPIEGEGGQSPYLLESGQTRAGGWSRSSIQNRQFEVSGGTLYFNIGGRLQRTSLTQRRWESVSVPVEGEMQMSLVRDRLYLQTADSLQVLTTAGDGVEILASNRRRPAQNALDRVDKLGSAVIFSGPTGAVWVAVQDKLWAYAEARKDWEVVGEALTSGHFGSEGVYFRKISEDKTQLDLFAWFAGQAAPFLGWRESIEQRPRYPLGWGMTPPPRASESASAVSPRWELPPRMKVVNGIAAMTSNRLWLFIGNLAIQSDNGIAALKEFNGRQGLLLGFDGNSKAPVIIPLKLEVPRDLARGAELNALVRMESFGQTRFQATPAGLVLTFRRLPGFWLLPQAELDRQWQEWHRHPPMIIYPEPANTNSNILPR